MKSVEKKDCQLIIYKYKKVFYSNLKQKFYANFRYKYQLYIGILRWVKKNGKWSGKNRVNKGV